VNTDLLCENSAVKHVDPYLTAKVDIEMVHCYAWSGCLNLQYGFLICSSFFGGEGEGIYLPPIWATYPTHLYFLNFITPIIFGEVHRPSSA